MTEPELDATFLKSDIELKIEVNFYVHWKKAPKDLEECEKRKVINAKAKEMAYHYEQELTKTVAKDLKL